jgi:Phage tail protein
MISTVTLTPPMSGAAAVTLHGNGQTNRNLARVQGLVGPPAPRDVVRPRSQADGIIDQTTFMAERTITLEGEIWGSTGGAAISDLSTVSEAFASSLLSPAKLTVTYENGTTRFCYVKLSGSVDVSVEGASRLVQYQVQLRAADPRWYSTTLNTVTLTRSTTGLTWSASTSSGTTNAGTAPSPLTVAVTAPSGNSITAAEIYVTVPSTYASLVPQTYTGASGSIPSFSILGTGTGFTVAAGTTRTFYSGTRTASSLSEIDSRTEWPMIYPGAVTMGILATSSNVNGASCVFTWYDAYI